MSNYNDKYYQYTYNPNRLNEYSPYNYLGTTRSKKFYSAYEQYDKKKEQEIADLYRYKEEPQEKRPVYDRVFDALSIGQYAVAGASKGAGDGWEEGYSKNGLLGGIVGGFAGAVKGTAQGVVASNPFGKGKPEWEYDFSDAMDSGGQYLNPIVSGVRTSGKIANYLGDKISDATGLERKNEDFLDFVSTFGERGQYEAYTPESKVGQFAKGALNFAGDIAIDPTTYMGGGLVKPLIKGSGKSVAVKGGRKVVEEVTESTVREMLENSGKLLGKTDSQIIRATDKLNKARGIVSASSDDLTFFGKKLIDGGTLQNIGDKTIAPYYNAMVDSLKQSPVAQLFQNSYTLRKLAVESPEKALDFIEYFDDLKLMKASKLLKDEEVRDVFEKLTSSFDEATRKEITHMIEDPKNYKTVSSWNKVSNDSDVYKKFQDVIKPFAEEMVNYQKRNKSLGQSLSDIKKVFTNDPTEIIQNLSDLKSTRVKEQMKSILDPNNKYKSFDELLDNLHPDDTYKLFADFEGDIDVALDIADDVFEETMEGQVNFKDLSNTMRDRELEKFGFDVNNFGEEFEVPTEVVEKNYVSPKQIGIESYLAEQRSQFNKEFQDMVNDTAKLRYANYTQRKNQVGYLPKVNQNTFVEHSKMLSDLPKLKNGLYRKPAPEKAKFINEVMFDGQTIAKDNASPKTLNAIIKHISNGDIKQAESLVRSCTQEGMDMYKYAMGKYGTEFLPVPNSHKKLSYDTDDIAMQMLKGDIDVDVEQLNKTYGKTGVQVYKTVGELKERFVGYEKTFNKLNQKRNVASYQQQIKEFQNIIDNSTTAKEKMWAQDKIKHLKNSFHEESVKVNGNKYKIVDGKRVEVKYELPKKNVVWGEAEEEALQVANREYISAKRPFEDRKNELRYIQGLTKEQYEYYLSHYRTVPFSQIPQKELQNIAYLTPKDIIARVESETLEASRKASKYTKGDSFAEENGVSEALNKIEDKRQSGSKKDYAGFDKRGKDRQYEASDYEVKLKHIRSKKQPKLDDDGNFVKNAKGEFVHETVLSKPQQAIIDYAEKTKDMLHSGQRYQSYSFEEREKMINQYDKLSRKLVRWMEGKSTSGFIMTPEEALDTLSKLDNKVTGETGTLVINLTSDGVKKFLGGYENGGKHIITEGLPFIYTNQEDLLLSTLALATNRPIKVLDDQGRFLASNLAEEKVKRGVMRGDKKVFIDEKLMSASTGKVRKVPQNSIYISNTYRQRYFKELALEQSLKKVEDKVLKEGSVDTLQEVANHMPKLNPALDELKSMLDIDEMDNISRELYNELYEPRSASHSQPKVKHASKSPSKVEYEWATDEEAKMLNDLFGVPDGVDPLTGEVLDDIPPMFKNQIGEEVVEVVVPNGVNPETGEFITDDLNDLIDVYDPKLLKEVYEGTQINFGDVYRDSVDRSRMNTGSSIANLRNAEEHTKERIKEVAKGIKTLQDAQSTDRALTILYNSKYWNEDMKDGLVEFRDGKAFMQHFSRILNLGKDTPDDVKNVLQFMTKEYARMGADEMSIGKLQKMIDEYVPHIVNPKVFEVPEVMEQLKKYDDTLYNKVLKYKDHRYNPFDNPRKIEGSVKDINDRMSKFFKMSGIEFDGDFFMSDMADLYLTRAMKSNELSYTGEFLTKTFNTFGEQVRFDGSYINPKQKYYIGQEDLQHAMRSVPQEIQYEVLKALKLDVDKPLYAPMLEVTGELGLEINNMIKKYDTGINFVGYQVDKGVANQLKQMGKIQQTEDIKGWLSLYDKALQLWKQNVTLTSPGFHIRNKFSNTFQNYLDIGAKVFDPEFNGKIKAIQKGASGELVTKNGQRYTYEEIRRMAEAYQVTDSGIFEKELGNKSGKPGGLLNYILGKNDIAPSSTLSKFDPTDAQNFKMYEWGRKAGNKVEGFGRMQNFVAGLENGLDPMDAVDHVNHFLFDYSDLTSFEHGVMKRIIPFYSWIRKNAPLQVEQLLTNPGRYSTVAKGHKALEKITPEEDKIERKYLPEFMQDWVQLPLTVTNPEGREEVVMFNPNMPYDALNMLSLNPKDIAKNAWGMTSPFIKSVVELGTGYNFFFESPIYDKKDYLLEMSGTPNIIYDAFDKKGLDKMLHLLNAGGGLKFSTYDYDKYTQHKRPKK